MPQKEDGPEYSTEEELVKQFKTDPNKGLSSAYAAQKLEQDGKNELYKPPRPSLLMLFVAQLAGFIIVLLIIAAIASMVVNATGSEERRTDGLSYTTGIAIFVIVLLNAGIAAYTENQAGGALDALAKMSQPSITVVRDGQEVDLDTTLIVEGDIVLIATGDVVPADLRLINATDVKVAEMCLTGEPDDVAKNAKLKVKSKGHGEPEKLTPENMCFSSCSCTNGKGKGIVVATAMKTRIGEIASHLATEGGGKKRLGCLPDTSANQTPLQVNVERLGARIGIGAIVVCIIVFIIGIAINTRDPDNPESPSWLYMILIAVTLAVAAIPEGIPLCVTISLSIGSSSMVKEHVLVRKLAAVETLGSASVICSDKTGTLTEGKMTMVHMWSGGIKYDVSGKGFDPTIGKVTRSAGGADANADFPVKTTLLAGVLCCKTKLLKVRDPDTREEKWEPKGNSSEAPIVVAAKKVGFGTEECEKEYPLVLEVPFSSSRKMMLTVSDVARRDSMYQGGPKLPPGTKYLSVCKGAPNYIIDTCNTMVDESGNIQTLSASEKANIMKVVDDYSSQALRVLAIAINPMDSLPFDPDPNNTDVSTEEKFEYCRKQLTLVGLVASIDPERDGVKQSVQDARGASIRVVMITGDYLKTAVAIARNITILESYEGEDAACDCAKLRPGGEYLSEEEIDALTQQTRCFARAKP
jgi:magnesium-transporting ATPase (P-type)